MMGYNIKLSESRDHIVLKITGNFKGQDMLKYIVEAHALGKESGINRYLVDVTEGRNVDSIPSNYEFAYSDLKKTEGVDFSAKVVALVSPGDHSHDFIETVLNNAGLPIKLFNDLEMAVKYLLGK